jgi:hypothetical protein
MPVVVVDAAGSVRVRPARELYEALARNVAFAGSELNIEGALLVADRLRFFQRGNGQRSGGVLGCRVGVICDDDVLMTDVLDASGQKSSLKIEGIEAGMTEISTSWRTSTIRTHRPCSVGSAGASLEDVSRPRHASGSVRPRLWPLQATGRIMQSAPRFARGRKGAAPCLACQWVELSSAFASGRS